MPTNLKNIAIADYDYPLPDSSIARYPLPQRDGSRLLLYTPRGIEDHRFSQLPTLLPSNATLVFNDTKVIHARLLFRKDTGATIEVFCLEPHGMAVSESFEQRQHCCWTCLVGNNKRWRGDALSRTVVTPNATIQLTARRLQAIGNTWVIEFNWSGGISFAELIEHAGVIPLPPYLGRDAEESDTLRYQTVYAQHQGSVAAPTAGLHFTPTLIEQLHRSGIATEYLTLHVGAGTFKPVSTPTIGEHEMHVEQICVSAELISRLCTTTERPVIAVGTTSVRTLESLYWFGVQLAHNPNAEAMHIDQWEPYTYAECNLGAQQAYANILQWLQQRGEAYLYGSTRLMIAPGYRYRTIRGLVTNFHQPKSTLLLLVSALVGDAAWRQCYAHAVQSGYRFLSYGDSCLFLP